MDQNTLAYQPDIEVQMTFLPTKAGGRKTPAVSGYRPQFYYNGHDWDAVHDYGTAVEVLPGQTVTAYVSFVSPECHLDRLYVGTLFLIREGQRTVAYGQVTRILNLPQSAQQADQERPHCYYTRYWPEHRGDEYAHWGGCTYYFACRSSGYPEQQIEIYDGGTVLWYDTIHHTDAYGMLSDRPIEFWDFEGQTITREQFERVRATTNPYIQSVRR